MIEVVPRVELDRYLGKWYEIAHLPARFQEGCSETTATYTLLKDGRVSVLNTCKRNGKVKTAKGKAKVVDKATGAKLKVTFFWPFYGDYWILSWERTTSIRWWVRRTSSIFGYSAERRELMTNCFLNSQILRS